jgi:hypothetical protein
LKLLLRQNKLQYLHSKRVEKTTGKEVDPIHTVVATGTIRDTTDGDTDDKSI